MGTSEELGNKVIVADYRVRIWEHRVRPGATGHMHIHRRPYFSVVVRGGTGETVDPDGTVLRSFDLTPGSVLWYGDDDVPETHAFRNTSEEEIVIVTTEFL